MLHTEHPNFTQIFREVVRNCFFYPPGALWYVWACITALIILIWFMKYNKMKCAVIIGVILYIFALVSNTYYFVIIGTPFQIVVDRYMQVFISVRNGNFVGILFISIGIECSKIGKVSDKKLNILLLFSHLVFCTEVFILKNLEFVDDKTLYISLVYLTPLLLIKATRFKMNDVFPYKMLRDLSVGIYFLHRVVLSIIKAFVKRNNMIFDNVGVFIVTVLLCILICLISYKVPNRFVKQLLK